MSTECVEKRIYEMTIDEFKIHQAKEVDAEVKELMESSIHDKLMKAFKTLGVESIESSRHDGVIKALESLGIELIDANNEYRSVHDILCDIADIWKCKNEESNK